MSFNQIRSPGTLADDDSYGSIAWNDPGNAGASDNSYAITGEIGSQSSHYLKATNFGFTVPADAVSIDGISVQVEGKKTDITLSPTIKEARVRLVKGGVIGGTDKLNSSNWTTSDATYTSGGAAELWGDTWTVANVNASNFGVVVAVAATPEGQSGTASIDHVQMTVYYTAPDSGAAIIG